MCICFYTLLDPTYSLVLISNRDEFLSRPTVAADWRGRNNATLCGLDVQAGGTWFGIEKEHGRFALLTNVREEVSSRSRSRGMLVSDWLEAEPQSTLDGHLDHLRESMMDYAGFNLLCGQVHPNGSVELAFLSNRSHHIQQHTAAGSSSGVDCIRDLENEGGPGVMSNGALACSLDSQSEADLQKAWPKMLVGREAFHAVLQKHERNGTTPVNEEEYIQELLDVLNLATPDIKDKEEVRSSVLVTPFDMFPEERAWYATRAQTVLLVERNTGICTYVERQAYEEVEGKPVWNGKQNSWKFKVADS